MLSQDYNDKDAISEHTLTKYVVSAVLLLSLFFAISKIVNDIIADTEQLAFDLKRERLERALTYIQQSWNQKGQPKKFTAVFQYPSGETKKLTVNVNQFGWPLNVGRVEQTLDCDNLWRHLVITPDNQQSEPLEIQIGQTRNTCRFSKIFDNNEIWEVEYNIENGRLVIK